MIYHGDEIPRCERYILGAMLIDNRVIPTVRDALGYEEAVFTQRDHQEFYRKILELEAAGEAVNIVMLGMKTPGKAPYIAQLTDEVITSANIDYYLGMVKEAHAVRRVLNTVNAITRKLSEADYTSSDAIGDLEDEIAKIRSSNSEDYGRAGDKLTEVIAKMEERIKNGIQLSGVGSGYQDLDAYTDGFQPSDLVIIGARPSEGKTALALSMAGNIAIHRGEPVGVISLEMSTHQLVQRLLGMESHVPVSSVRRSSVLKASDFGRIMDAAGLIHKAELLIYDRAGATIDEVRTAARRMHADGCRIIFVDYIGLIDARKYSDKRHEEVGYCSRALKGLARKLNVPIIALSQIRRESEGTRPSLRDLRESGSIEQDADVVMFIYDPDSEDKKSGVRELIIEKHRNGPTGTVELYFNMEHVRFESVMRSRGREDA